MYYHYFLGFLAVVAAYPGIIHDEAPQLEAKYDHHALIGESGHHHQVEHEHAKSHQSIKFEHFHPVPVYVKKEHSHLLKHPLEKGKSESNLKLIHPETQHNHGHGLVLEDDRHNTDHHAAALEHGSFEQGGYEHLSGGFEGGHGGFEGSHGGFEGGHGGFEGGHASLESGHGGFEGYSGGEGLKAYSELSQPQAEGHYYAEAGHALAGDSGEGYKYESY
ncbi:glycine-rich cell wall structural protein-like [Trichoplusia ni]|uniref:Glycine-rich cell wall structural protein-like n=1 Tax=Trichoplusia ni TaxID=7111 RepID=A0A7E5VR45_TRINI|nr:glycine-rich cell wall structural protein-like [Trichoplusia ni]